MKIALQKGLWFIFGNFLSVQRWESNFVPSRAKQHICCNMDTIIRTIRRVL